MSRRLTQTDETKLARAVESVVTKQADGDSATAALTKTATEMGLMPGEVKAVAHSVNTGAQLHQMDTNKTALSRFASFDLCDPEAVIASMVSSHKEAGNTEAPRHDRALSIIHSSREVTSKTATNVKVAFEHKAATVPSVIPSNTRHEYFKAKTAHLQARMHLSEQVRKLASLLTGYREDGQLILLKQAAASKHGLDAAAVLFRSACKEAGWAEDHFDKLEKRTQTQSSKIASADHPVLKQFDVCMGECVKVSDFAAELNRQMQLTHPPSPGKTARIGLVTKTGGAMDVALGNILASSFYPNTMRPGAAGQMVAKKQDELDDPIQDQRIRNYRTQGMLSQLLTNPADQMSGSHPLAVSEAYNELSSLAPRAAQQGAIVAPWLRRRLEGKIEPFEAKAVADTEKVLKSNAGGSAPSGSPDM
jgi:hypothetical protein